MTYPTLEETRGATLVEGEHLWIAWQPKAKAALAAALDREPGEPLISCRWCGIVKRRDGKNRPCRGIVRVSLR